MKELEVELEQLRLLVVAMVEREPDVRRRKVGRQVERRREGKKWEGRQVDRRIWEWGETVAEGDEKKTTTSGLIETTNPDSTTVTPPATTVTPAPTTPPDRVVNITAKAKCLASFVCQPMGKYCSSCYSAIDGDKSTSWHYRGVAVGAWLQIVFDGSYNVSLLQIAPSYWAAQRHFKDIKLTFSDGGEQKITLSDGNDGWVTESFTIEPPRLSTSLKLSVVSAYDDSETLQNSVNELGVYGFTQEETRALRDIPKDGILRYLNNECCHVAHSLLSQRHILSAPLSAVVSRILCCHRDTY
ncbi:hypothetical protein LSAT2_000886 [Lamellibrachia satsuma]|nr:hypothetical protein LSAT2_000886 [Lamellibrachia satsuma]